MKIIECPRDALQGIDHFIPTQLKADYINQLLRVGFDAIDFGSFVSRKAVPQMSDSSEVLKLLNLQESSTKLLAIVANERGAEEALKHSEIAFLGYPFSISETFQLRNTGATLDRSLDRVRAISSLCKTYNRRLVIYISMAFGNPYNEVWNADTAIKWIDKMTEFEIGTFSLSDTVGVAKPSTITYLFDHLIRAYPDLEFGAHFHSSPHSWKEKIEAAWESGCNRFDSAILGYGGCPMAKDDLVGNIATENLLEFFAAKGIKTIDPAAIKQLQIAFKKLLKPVQI